MEQKGESNRILKATSSRRARLLLNAFLRRAAMGEIRAKVRLENYADRILSQAGKIPRNKIRVRNIEAVVDTGAVMVLLPQDLVESMGLRNAGQVIVQLANDQRIELPRVDGVSLTVAGREMFTDCLVGPPGCEPLIGQLVMERLDLIADPGRRTLTPRPESPYLPTLKLKALAATPLCGALPVS